MRHASSVMQVILKHLKISVLDRFYAFSPEMLGKKNPIPPKIGNPAVPVF